jgi:SGNH domain (fused to AT3 domains)
LLGGTVAVAAPGAGIRWKEGVSGRFPLSVEQTASEANNKKPRRDECFTKGGTQSPSCMYGGTRLRAILIGDSHGDAVTTALAAAVPSEADGIMDWTYVSCLTARGVKNLSPGFGPKEKCGEFLEWAFAKLNDVPKDIPLVIVNRTTVYALGHNEPWENDANVPAVYFTQRYSTSSPAFLSEFAQRVTDTACELAKDRTVYLVRPIPEIGIDVPKAMGRAMSMGIYKDVSISLLEYHLRHATTWAAQDAARDRCGVKILDPLPYLCWDGRCQGAKDGRSLYYDDDHLSEWGNKLLVPMFAEVFQSL